jgi:nucleotide-binding universal stress UspA family protein
VTAIPSPRPAEPIVVYHAAGMGNWEQVVPEQLQALAESGLRDVRLTHVGAGLDRILDEARQRDIHLTVVRSDPNLAHYETFGILEVERLAKQEKTDRPILYLHTKGVSNPADGGKASWRRVMQDGLVRRWNVNVGYLTEYDAVGVNFQNHGEQHFSGNFWLARPDWIRRLPDYAAYHGAKGLTRYSAEMWIGAACYIRAKSLLCQDQNFWSGRYDFGPLYAMLPPGPSQRRIARRPDPETPFAEIFDVHETDKQTEHSYAAVYDTLFPAEERSRVRRVLEIGVQKANSLWAWQEALPEARVYGLDVNLDEACPGHRSVVACADAASPTALLRAMRLFGLEPGSLDLIVDDGSHRFADQLGAAHLLKPYMAPDGALRRRGRPPRHAGRPVGRGPGRGRV